MSANTYATGYGTDASRI